MANRLAEEASPYLRQHADNPVDWLPWSDEALERAVGDERPILLSIGYSACHWCHVMERESFSDPAVAEVMNRGFVSVKVDREERPDVDAVYMRAVQALTGRGGWPLTVFLTPDGRPFYGGTYFPPEPRHGMPSFRQVLDATLAAWTDRRGEVENAAGEITGLLERMNRAAPGARDEGAAESAPPLDAAFVHRAADALLAQVDRTHGGFGGAPKFPQPMAVGFLLAHHARSPEVGAGPDAALHTLRRMARGGIRDHLGGGFHRYAVDARWLVPHFEKMLYDNALLASAYLQGWQLTGDPELEGVVRTTLDYLLDDLRSPEGGFYAARDADSEGEEGRFYVWTKEEIDALLDPEDARLFSRCYGVSPSGNWEGRTILNLAEDPEEVARSEGVAPTELEERLERSRRTLLEARSGREPPLRDSKILAGWNGLALRALADAGAALDEPRYLDAARDGAEWLLEALRPEGRLLHQVPAEGGSRRIPAFLEDVAALAGALVSLHEATLEPRWLDEAATLAGEIEERFRDPDSGLLFDTPADGGRLVVRPRDTTDNAVPAGSSLAADLYLRLGRVLGRPEWSEAARGLVEENREALIRMPSAFGLLLQVAEALVQPPVEVALVGGEGGEAPGGADAGVGGDADRDTAAAGSESGIDALLLETHRHFVPGRVVSGRRVPERDEGEGAAGPREDGSAGPALEIPLLEGRGPVDGRAAAYVCRHYTCRAPVTTVGELREALEEAARG